MLATLPRACAPELNFLAQDITGPCVDVPFMTWLILAPGLDGCFPQDCTHCPEDSVNSPKILRRSDGVVVS